MNNLVGQKVWIERESYLDESCGRSRNFTVIVPDLTPEDLSSGLTIAEVTPQHELEDVATVPVVVKFENGHYGVICTDYPDKSRLILSSYDNPRAMSAIWNAPQFPQRDMFRSGREYWHIPRTGYVKAFFNENKEDDNYHPDEFHPYMSLGALTLRRGFITPNDFLCDNRLYGYVQPERDMTFFDALGIKSQKQVIDVSLPYMALLAHMQLLVQDLAQGRQGHVMFTVVTLDPHDSKYREFGPYYSNKQVDVQGRYFRPT